jgi:large subunit ribosomal protein L3
MSVLLGRKIGMTSIFTETGDYVPCTVIEAGPCPVVQVRTKENDGYEAVQIGFGDIPARKVNKPVAGHFAKAKVEFKRILREFRSVKTKVKVGDELKTSLSATRLKSLASPKVVAFRAL